MSIAIGLPVGYPWVIAAATGTIFLNIWQSLLVSAARKKAGIKYPQVYATKEEEASNKDAKIFNCVQRSHANSLESVHHYILMTLISGLRHPRPAVGLASVYLIGRVMYTLGYSTGEPSSRAAGAGVGAVAQLGLLGTTVYTIFQYLSETNFQL
ncbi:hypothetical protein CBS101457_004397 [Exobasidium rhododendri]|nr:hypothetical protein CBS101457_004397 [Exobasidium rhododendri]